MIEFNDNNRLFKRAPISQFFQSDLYKITNKIENEDFEVLLSVDPELYCQEIESIYRLETPILDFTKMTSKQFEELVSGSQFPPDIFVYKDKEYKIWVHGFYIPCSGHINLLVHYSDSIHISEPPIVIIKSQEIYFELRRFRNNIDDIKTRLRDILKEIETQYNDLRIDIEKYNASLGATIAEIFNKRKENLKLQSEIFNEIDVKPQLSDQLDQL